MSNTVVIIPARLNAKRLPNKPLKLINNKSINLERLISDYYDLKEINVGISKILEGEISGRIMIKF